MSNWKLIEDLREFECSDAVGHGDFELCRIAADVLETMEWQPLETAPVGESVQLAYKLALGTAIGHKGEDGVWRGHEGSVWGDGTARFSHWKPESEPPAERPHNT